MIKKLLFSGFVFGMLSTISAQSVQINPDDDPASDLTITQLIDNVLIDNDNIVLIPSSVRLLENPVNTGNFRKSWGYFNQGTSSFPFQDGIVLTTGSATFGMGPNDDSGSGILRTTGWFGDADLTKLLNDNSATEVDTFNATVLEFSLVPYGFKLKFDFIFASEEYNAFECSGDGKLRDGFAFLIKGPGIPNDSGTAFGGTNLAAVPGSANISVNTGSIHESTLRCPDRTGGVAPFPDIEQLGINFFPEFYIDNPTGSEILEYNGYTKVLPTEIDVIPGETYTLKLVIADRGDESVDSAVFVQGISADSNVIIENTSAPMLTSEDFVLCTSDIPQTLTARFRNTSFSGLETYVWRLNNQVIPGADTNTIEIVEGGDYSVFVTDIAEKSRDGIKVTLSRGPETLALSVSSDSVTDNAISATATGIGMFQYVMDGGIPQDSGEFTDVTLGEHTIKVFDIEGCGEITKSIFVTGFPKYFTPNGDGFHDTWNAIGDEDLAMITISIFDRFGKFITMFRADGAGWDGNYNGKMLPASEYWFSVEINGNKESSGHFSLIR